MFHLDSCGSLLADLVDVVVLLAVAPVRLPHRHPAPVRADHHLLSRGITRAGNEPSRSFQNHIS